MPSWNRKKTNCSVENRPRQKPYSIENRQLEEILQANQQNQQLAHSEMYGTDEKKQTLDYT